jgi:predicted GNAT family acetyltransferase
MRVVEHASPRAFEQRVGRWLLLREAENSYLLGQIPNLIAKSSNLPSGSRIAERLFSIEDGDQIMAVGILFAAGCLCLTWATDDMVGQLVEYMANSNCRTTSVYAPGHVSWQFAKTWTQRTGEDFVMDRSERVYQLARCSYTPSSEGRFELATEADKPVILPWVEGFMREAEFEADNNSAQQIADMLVQDRVLYLWKQPQAVSMAAWLAPTANGGSINFVYTPQELRGKGYAKSVCVALANRMLANGRKYCFILTDTQDERTNHLYQSIGARTLCELLRCKMQPKSAAVAASGAKPVAAAQ